MKVSNAYLSILGVVGIVIVEPPEWKPWLLMYLMIGAIAAHIMANLFVRAYREGNASAARLWKQSERLGESEFWLCFYVVFITMSIPFFITFGLWKLKCGLKRQH
jgi:hypothetical protein